MVGDAGSACWAPEESWPPRATADPVRRSLIQMTWRSSCSRRHNVEAEGVELSHGNLTSYITGTVEFGSAHR